MSWQYRVVRHEENPDHLMIHEVYFNDDGSYRNMTEGGVTIGSEDIQGISDVLDMMGRAVNRTIIDFDGDKSDVKLE